MLAARVDATPLRRFVRKPCDSGSRCSQQIFSRVSRLKPTCVSGTSSAAVSTPAKGKVTRPVIVVRHKPSMSLLNASTAMGGEETANNRRTLVKLRQLVQVGCSTRSGRGNRAANKQQFSTPGKPGSKAILRKLVGSMTARKEPPPPQTQRLFRGQSTLQARSESQGTGKQRYTRARSERNVSLELPDDSNYLKIVSFVQEIKSVFDFAPTKHNKTKSVAYTSRTRKNEEKSINSDSKPQPPLSCRSFADTASKLSRLAIAARLRRYSRPRLNLIGKQISESERKHESARRTLSRAETSPQRLVVHRDPGKPSTLSKPKYQTPRQPRRIGGNLRPRELSVGKPCTTSRAAKNTSVEKSTEKTEGGDMQEIIRKLKQSAARLNFVKMRKVLHVQKGETVNLCPRLETICAEFAMRPSVRDVFFMEPKIAVGIVRQAW